MTLNELKIDELALICEINYTEGDSKELCKLMTKGVVPGLEISKLGEVSTCAEYKVEGVGPRFVIDNCLGDYIIVVRI